MGDSNLENLWTFENQSKLDQFAAILTENDILYEIVFKNEKKKSASGITISVDEKDYQKAKKLLMKHRKRRTSA
jgi:hypothetical protein